MTNKTVQYWLTELEAAQKREKDFRKEGKRILELYECSKSEESPFNILYSNTETLAPALYNNTPRPVVQRRYKDDDPLGLQASKATQRTLEFFLDSSLGIHTPFDDLMQSAVLEALLPGRGLTRFKYDAEMETVPAEVSEAVDESAEPAAPAERVTCEHVVGEEVPWDKFFFGYAKKWRDVPWIAFEHQMDKAEVAENFGKEIAAAVEYSDVKGDDDKLAGTGWNSRDEESKGEKLACVYEIWDRASMSVIFISPGLAEGPLRVVPDPLKLTGFFPCPRPLGFFARVTSLVPVGLYKAYETQAKELNVVTTRIAKITAALKVRGFYDATVEGLDKVLRAEDNELVPAENVAALQQGQTLEKAIVLMPIDKLIAVLQQLYNQRQQVKQVIYEITGISDILRGASVASETATAQNIKNQWGTLRLKRMQKEVARYCRDCLRIVAEIAVTKFSPETMAKMTELPFPTSQQKQQAAMQLQQAKLLGQQNPQAMQQMAPQLQKLQAIASGPSWDDILGMLRDDALRSYHIDIETNSTVDVEATEDKQNINELLNAMAQFFSGIGPMVENGTIPFDVAKEMLLAVVRRYRFGDDVEDALKQMQAPQPKPDPKAASDQAKAQNEQAKGQLENQKAQIEIQRSQAEAATAAQEESLKQRTMLLDFQLKQAEHEQKMEELQLKRQIMKEQAAVKIATMEAQRKAAAASAAKPAGITKK